MKLVIGCGYLGLRVAKLWLSAGERVAALTRSTDRAAELAALGIEPIVADVTRPETLVNLPIAETVLFAVGYDRAAGNSQHTVYVDGLRNVLAAIRNHASVQRFLYVSTTGVYGEAGGDWVDEATPCAPTTPGGAAHYAAEQLLVESSLAPRSVILRMAGLYGPGRVPRSADLLAGRPIAMPAESFLNLIHIDDAARIVVAAEKHAWDKSRNTSRIYNVSDGHPTTRREYLETMARLLDAPPPLFVASDNSSRTKPATRGANNRRISNQKLLAEFEMPLLFPTALSGLVQSLAVTGND